MNRSGAWIALSVAALCIKLLVLAGKSRPKYDTFDTYKPYGSYGSTYDPLKYQYPAYPTKQKLELEAALAETVERHCQASAKVYLEPQGTHEATFRALRKVSAPKTATIPQPWTALGLPVLPVVPRGEDVAICLDADDALVRDLADRSDGPSADALKQVGPGAWTVTTSTTDQVPAVNALVSKRFLAKLATKGALVAFAPTDGQVAFADSWSPAAVKLAAKALAPNIDVTGTSGIDFAQPLILKAGKWEKWTPSFQAPELTEVMRRSAEANTAGAIEVLDQVMAFDELSEHRAAVTEGFVTTRTWDESKGATAELESGSVDPQWVGRAAHVRIGITTLDWNGFVKAAGPSLKPVMVDGAVVPDVYVLEAGFHVPALASYR